MHPCGQFVFRTVFHHLIFLGKLQFHNSKLIYTGLLHGDSQSLVATLDSVSALVNFSVFHLGAVLLFQLDQIFLSILAVFRCLLFFSFFFFNVCLILYRQLPV